jgi:4-alpha-glucanotransferase
MTQHSHTASVSRLQSLAAAKREQGIDRLVLQVHDASFPSDADEDLGRGSPYSRGAERLMAWAADLGFDAIQLAPRGMTTRGNSSPYDATIFSRNPLDLPLLKFVESGRLNQKTWDSIRQALSAPKNGSIPYPQLFDASQRAFQEIVNRATTTDREAARQFITVHSAWLIPDALYGVLCEAHGSGSWYDWNRTAQGVFDQRLFNPEAGQEEAAVARFAALQSQHASAIEDYALIQWLLAEENQALRQRASEMGLALYGDLQVGLSLHDTWAWQKIFLKNYRMGAPPSRTNPAGQPWGYGVLDPEQFGTAENPGPALAFVRARISRVVDECDGLRIDHPHGWVDPWIYRADIADPYQAVQNGARLYSSPDDPKHPELANFAIARPEQIDRSQDLHADGHVQDLEDEQVRRYSVQIDEIIAQQSSGAAAGKTIACEVLSTLPYPVARVMARHELGRFRVTQKINLTEPRDVYRIENAQPQDWVMLGTHDTPPIWLLAEKWCHGPEAPAWGKYLANLLMPPAQIKEFAAEIAKTPGKLINACFAAMLASQARHVLVFFPDLFGMTDRYNEPGVCSDANWSLRVPANFEEFYQEKLQQGQALDLEQCFQMTAKSTVK